MQTSRLGPNISARDPRYSTLSFLSFSARVSVCPLSPSDRRCVSSEISESLERGHCDAPVRHPAGNRIEIPNPKGSCSNACHYITGAIECAPWDGFFFYYTAEWVICGSTRAQPVSLRKQASKFCPPASHHAQLPKKTFVVNDTEKSPTNHGHQAWESR